MEKTTIQIRIGTLNRLKNLKKFERESYDEVINFIADDYEDEELTEGEINAIQTALEDVRKNGTIPIEEVMKEAGISFN